MTRERELLIRAAEVIRNAKLSRVEDVEVLLALNEELENLDDDYESSGIFPCPCCGSDVDLVYIDDPESPHQGGKYIECQNRSCRLTSVIAFGEDADLLLITRWNKRYKSDQDAQTYDAKRYRWLRNRDVETIANGGVFAGITPDNFVLSGDDLDMAVDAAMRLENFHA